MEENMVNKDKSKKICSQKCGSGTGRGWYEDEDPHLGKARWHSEVAQKEKLRDTLTRPMKKDESPNESTTEEIIKEVQNKRKPSAVAEDESQTAEKVGDKEEPEDFINWIKEPGKSDLAGVDTKKNKPKNNEDEDEN
jgi:hypothetical protein